METVQYIFLAIGLTIMLVGLARGYNRELGNSIILMITIAVFGFFEARYEATLTELAQDFLGVSDTALFLFLFYSVVFIAIVFSTYNGVTLDYGGKPTSGLGGTLLSLVVGVFNGYLIAGTLWYYAAKFNYPLLNLGSPGTVAEWLPPTIFPDPLYWVVPAAVLLILRVRG